MEIRGNDGNKRGVSLEKFTYGKFNQRREGGYTTTVQLKDKEGRRTNSTKNTELLKKEGDKRSSRTKIRQWETSQAPRSKKNNNQRREAPERQPATGGAASREVQPLAHKFRKKATPG